ncbi:hypothetical protein [Burkholderia sp. Ac-20344]|uniref:hypothetical protein n=1 Tax=Burkholderia sp. Ac-20344 TaxID=2703890 RepID=UPI00197B6D03|nr:hypothetical protein [Burkholderia sp. Ac-20344]MBN3830582.1 hypothetical protein [Burkholderia sp. Ac-20344]
MSYWRKFLVVVLLALSLPIQSFATVSMPCTAAVAPYADEASHTMPVAQDGHRDAGSHARHAPSCSACVSCCFGAGMSGIPAVSAAVDIRVAIASSPPAAVVVSFLTGGIDRPPRRMLV